MSLNSARMPSLKEKHAAEEAALKSDSSTSPSELKAVTDAGKRILKEIKRKVSKKDVKN